MKTRTYLKGCEWCNSTGYIQLHYHPQNAPTGSATLTNICPVCNGSGTVTVTETED